MICYTSSKYRSDGTVIVYHQYSLLRLILEMQYNSPILRVRVYCYCAVFLESSIHRCLQSTANVTCCQTWDRVQIILHFQHRLVQAKSKRMET